ncbi:alcohol oxidase [Daedaleopsis nitida]|nr:alcohol oxidase [Daedaleopsis nitida]
MLHRAFVALALAVGLAQGTLFEGPTEEVLQQTYDVIVVGAGAGGAVMAARLSEDPRVRVLLVEAGGSDYMNFNISVPARSSTLTGSRFDWNYTTAPQTGLNDREITYPRGHVLGGSTATNQMVFSRGTIDDYGRWARVTGDDNWTWDGLAPFRRMVDRMTEPADHHDTTGQFDPALHYDGPVSISVAGFPLPINPGVITTTEQLPEDFPFNLDYNSGNPIGISWVQSTIKDGHRVTSATSYLADALNRTNLDVLVNTRVTKVLPVALEDGTPAVRGVQLAQSENGPYYTINATQELILSAGSINTPHILMLSGIGDASSLSAFGIESLVDHPTVGQNLQDHPFLGMSWFVNSDDTLDNIRRNTTLAAELISQWEVDGTGPMGLAPSSQFGWLRVPDSANFFASLGLDEDPSAGPTSAHFEMIPENAFVSKRVTLPAEGHFFSFIAAVVSPTARGNVSLASANPFDAPIINPNLLGTSVDVAVMREAVKTARKFVTAPVWSDYILSEFGAFAEAITDDELDAFIRDQTDTVDHPVGTVAMGGEGAALDSELRVRGTKGLRVVDASAFPYITSAHTQAPVYILAERAAALVREGLTF